MAHGVGADQAQEHVVVLLPLVLVDRRHPRGEAQKRVASAASLQNVSNQALLPVVRGEDGNLVRGVAAEAHEAISGHHILRFPEVLVEEGGWAGLPAPQKVWHVHKLVRARKPGVRKRVHRSRGRTRGGLGKHGGQVGEFPLVAPRVELGNVGAGAALLVEQDVGHPQTDEAGEQRLVQLAVLLQACVLHHRGQLVVVSNQAHPQQAAPRARFGLLVGTAVATATAAAGVAVVVAACNTGQGAVVGWLEEHGDHGLQLQHLRCLLHHQIVIPEPEVDELAAGDGGVRARHGHDPRLLQQQVVGPHLVVPQQLERAEVRQLLKHLVQVSEAAARAVKICLFATAAAPHAAGGGVLEERLEREVLLDGASRKNRRLRLGLEHFGLELLNAASDVEQVEELSALARVSIATCHLQRVRKPLHLLEQLLAPTQREVDPPKLAEVPSVGELAQLFHPTAQPQQVPLQHVPLHDLLKQVV
mmetsp:Transcript_30411/g.51334  ORF Transcript_30411/g.51334 Transcript_30411/m.51334 type:complete len:474 (+) Transcript_30411:569-1990(+)